MSHSLEVLSVKPRHHDMPDAVGNNLLAYTAGRASFSIVAFAGAQVEFQFEADKRYPDTKPVITCKTPVYHPNVASDGRICFSMLTDDWLKQYRYRRGLLGPCSGWLGHVPEAPLTGVAVCRLEHYINGLLWFLGALHMSHREQVRQAFRVRCRQPQLGLSAEQGVLRLPRSGRVQTLDPTR